MPLAWWSAFCSYPPRSRKGSSISSPRGCASTRSSATLLRRHHHDLHQRARVGELRLDAGTCGQVLRVGPRGPDFVHRRAIADVGDPDRRGEDLRLVRSGLRQQPVDLVEDFLGLTLDVRLQLFGDDAGKVDGVSMLYCERKNT